MANDSIAPAAVAAARNAGYSDDEIVSHLAEKYPDQFNFKAATDAGYSSKEVLDHLAPTDAPMSLAGSAKAVGSGLLKGLVGVPGNIADLETNLLELGRKKFDEAAGRPFSPIGDFHPLGGAYDTLREATDKLYTPQNTPERVMQTGAEWAPAVATGPEPLMGKGAMSALGTLSARAVRQAAIPGAASAGMGRLTEGSDFQVPAQVAAAMLAGRVAGKPAAAVKSRDVLDQSSADYQAFRDAKDQAGNPVVIDPQHAANFAQATRTQMTKRGLDNQPAFNLFKPFANQTEAVTPSRLQQLKEDLSKEAGAEGGQGTAGGIGVNNFKDFMNTLQPAHALSGGAAVPKMVADYEAARQNSEIGHQLRVIERPAYAAQQQTNATYSGDNLGNKTRQKMSGLAIQTNEGKNPRLTDFQPDLEDITQGQPKANAARWLANKITGHNSFIAPLLIGEAVGGVAGIPTGLMAGGATSLVGSALRRYHGATTAAQVQDLLKKIGAGAVRMPPTPTSNYSPLLTRLLIGTTSAGANR